MRLFLALALTLTLAVPLAAQEAVDAQTETAADVVLSPVEAWLEDRERVFEAAEVDLDAFRWIARPVVVFADSPFDQAFQEQMASIADRADALAERDVVVIVDTDPAAQTDVRRRLRPRGFALVIVDKEGTVMLRKPAPWSVREITRSIDKMPTRQQEIRDGSRVGG